MSILKMTTNCILHLIAQTGEILGLSEIDSLSARAVYPPSGAFSTKKTIRPYFTSRS